MPTTARRDYDTQAWRDLHWLLNSPSLVEELAGYGAAEFSAEQLAEIHEWMRSVTPDRLSADLHTQFRRLGLYAEALLRTALEHTPACQLLLQHFPIQEDLANNTKGKRTIGELDYVWRDTLSGEVHHWELAVKLYLYIPPNFPANHPIRLLPPKQRNMSSISMALSGTELSIAELNDESVSALISLDRFVGTQRIDTLYRKLNHLQERQLPLAQHPQVRATLQQEIHQSAYYMKGWLFYPLRPQHAEDWSSYYLPESQVSVLLNPHHLRGWWLLEDEFEQHLAQQEQANQPWRWKILQRLQWLSQHRCTYAETLTGTELWESIQAHWTFFKEKEETPQPQLVVALQEDKQTSGQWHEVHRGFVVPSEW